jgi:predicted DNA-binding transcriptional regulator AlpA
MTYEFILRFKVPALEDFDELVEKLGEAGCDDATVGGGIPGRIALDFARDSGSAEEAILSAIENVKRAIPDAELIEASPDYVGLTDIAAIAGMSRQNIRKLAISHADFPEPVHSGSAQFWHLLEVLNWLARRKYPIANGLVEVARVAMQCNVAKESSRLKPENKRLRAPALA